MSEAITVTVNYIFRPGMEVMGKQLLLEFVEANRNANGCNEIALHQDLKNPAKFISISKWESMDDLMTLLGDERVKEVAEHGKQMLLKPFKVQIWTALT